MLCPFAVNVVQKDQVRYRVCLETEENKIVERVKLEVIHSILLFYNERVWCNRNPWIIALFHVLFFYKTTSFTGIRSTTTPRERNGYYVAHASLRLQRFSGMHLIFNEAHNGAVKLDIIVILT